MPKNASEQKKTCERRSAKRKFLRIDIPPTCYLPRRAPLFVSVFLGDQRRSANRMSTTSYGRLAPKRPWITSALREGPFSVLVRGGEGGNADVIKFSLELKPTSSKSEHDTEGICSPLETRETAMRVLLKTPSALTWVSSSLSSSVTSTLCSLVVSSPTLPGVLDERTSALLGALIGARPWE